ncbi:MAG: phosphoribosylformylglycinamidine synthase, partial [Clostridia bacterium]|nr:phosphoribosylformylglycinamidine synthase [Clostridia bacterium]
MVYRIYVEKKAGFDHEAQGVTKEIREILGLEQVKNVRVINRYDVEGIEKSLFDSCVKTVFSEPQMDNATETFTASGKVFAVEYLPGQFDQRADSAAQCIQLISQKERPLVRTAKVYVVEGEVSDAVLAEIKKFLINPVESREASLAEVETLKMEYEVPTEVETLHDFLKLEGEELAAFVKKYALAMDADDVAFCRDYFLSEGRAPTLTEIRMIDTYWSDHCRHTTFLTTVDAVTFDDSEIQATWEDYLETRKFLNRTKPINLMDVGTLAAKYLKKTGKLEKLDESEEINACTVKMKVTVEG